MYKIDKNFEEINLNGSIVISVSYFINEFRIKLSNKSNYKEIVCYGDFYTEINGVESFYREIFPIKSDFGLLNLIDQEIVKVSVSNDRRALSLTFKNNIKIKFEENSMYETLHIRNEEELTIFIM